MLFYLLEACGSIELPQRFLSGVEGWDRGTSEKVRVLTMLPEASFMFTVTDMC